MSHEPTPASLAGAYRALTAGAGVVDVSDWTQIELTGHDRATFLNGFCTNDVKRLQPGQGCEAFVTDVKGKTLGHVFISVGEGSIAIVTVPGQAERLLTHLDRYLITEDVQLTDRTRDSALLFVSGAAAGELLSRGLEVPCPEPAWSLAEATCGQVPVTLRRAPITEADGFLLSCPQSRKAPVLDALIRQGVESCGPEAWEVVRLEAGMPLYGRDISEQNLPQEVGRDDLAISFTKGCYLGQETVARLDALGHVNRLLRQLEFATQTVPIAGVELQANGHAVGQVTSAVWSPQRQAPVALGYVRREYAGQGRELDTEVGRAIVV